MSTSSANGSAAKQSSFFDLHINGIGYVNRIREVRPRKGDPFLACDISALNGPSESPDYVRFDVKVAGKDAQHLIRRCEDACKADRKVLMGFRLGDPWVDVFTYRNGPKAGATGVALKARLIAVKWIRIDGEEVYKAESRAADEAAAERACVPASASAFDDGPESGAVSTEASPTEAAA